MLNHKEKKKVISHWCYTRIVNVVLHIHLLQQSKKMIEPNDGLNDQNYIIRKRKFIYTF